MKQILIGGDVAYGAGATDTDLSGLKEGAIVCNCLVDHKKLTAKPVYNFSIALGRGENKLPFMISEVDVRTLSATKAEYSEGTTYEATISLPAEVKEDKDYTIIIAKQAVVLNERNRWTATARANASSTPVTIAKELVKRINYTSELSGVKAEATGAKITITGEAIGQGYNVIGGDALSGAELTDVTLAEPAILDAAYVKDMASRCAAGKGVEYLGEDGGDIYPGYPEKIEADEYTMFTLRFAVPRVAAKQRDEVVYQTVHICIPKGSAAEGTLDTIFGTKATKAAPGN